MRYLISIILIIFTVHFTIGQSDQVTFQLTGKSVVQVGEQFRVVYSVNADGDNFSPPSFEGFRVLSGPNPSTSSNIQIVNGAYTRSYTKSFTYYLYALQEGDFEILPATITVNGKKHTSNKLDVKVVKGSNPSPQQGNNQRSTRQQGISEQDIFLRSTISNTNPYLGDQIIVTYKIFTRVPIPQYGINKFPSFNGFWSQDLIKENEQLRQSREIINGQEYIVAEIKKVALFPLKSGELTIEPFELNVVAQVRSAQRRNTGDPFFDRFFDDSFFGGGYQNIEKVLISKPVKVNVKPLPLENKPANFRGAVGQFSLKSNIDKTKVKVNEAINLKFTIWGKGNTKLIDDLAIAFPPDFEVFEPKINDNVKTSSDGVTGVRTVEYLLIPRNAGTFLIKPVNFSYFDPANKKYVTLSTDSYTIEVEKGDGAYDDVTYNSQAQEEIQYIGSDIRYIKTLPMNLTRKGNLLFGSFTYLLMLGLIFLLSVLIIFIIRRYQKKYQDKQLMKTKRATRTARRRLKKANQYLQENNENEFYNEISQALWGYLGDKFNIPVSYLSIDTVNETLNKKEVKEELIDKFIQTLNNCEYARFAPSDQEDNMERIYNEALELITLIEKSLK